MIAMRRMRGTTGGDESLSIHMHSLGIQDKLALNRPGQELQPGEPR